jgi:hypothetical protein
MSQGARDWVWSAGIGCALTVISTLALAVPPTNDMIRVISYVGAPGALTGITLAVLTTGSYGGSGFFILAIAAMLNLTVYTLVVVSVIRAFRAVRKRAH